MNLLTNNIILTLSSGFSNSKPIMKSGFVAAYQSTRNLRDFIDQKNWSRRQFSQPCYPFHSYQITYTLESAQSLKLR